ncbi:DUF6221 family protein [Streptomyces sp.]|uniref:DUF6221 family protein n=1 Tax=Streptomyces sp. TaxID=1931 RepID=UPI002810DE06|nr:DUF6221 family protein [Streptomyces sp.]
MDDLVQWLGAQLDEDERIARVASSGPWSVDNATYAETIYAVDGTAVVGGGRWGGEASVFDSAEDALHIAAHDPARVLREIDAKRQALAHFERIQQLTKRDIEAYVLAEGAVSKQIQIMATAYADRPGYREEWRP